MHKPPDRRPGQSPWIRAFGPHSAGRMNESLTFWARARTFPFLPRSSEIFGVDYRRIFAMSTARAVSGSRFCRGSIPGSYYFDHGP